MTNVIQDPIAKRWAFLVGINKYDDPGYGKLEFCVDDVKTLGRLLQDDLGFDVTCLHDDPPAARYKPIRNSIKAELKLVCDAVEPDDLLLVHFACHGIQINNQPCLVTSEVRSFNPEEEVLPIAQVKKLMEDSGARCKVLLLDACHTGVDMGRYIPDLEFMRHEYEEAEGFAIIAASTAQQKAYEIAGHGVFTHYLLAALRGDADGYQGMPEKGFVSVQDCRRYVLNEVTRWKKNTGMVQTPTSQIEGVGDMILAYYPEQLKTPIAIADPTDEAMAGRVKEREQPVNQPVTQPVNQPTTQPVNQPQASLSSLERLELMRTLNGLPESQFEELVAALNPPKGILPSGSAAQGTRSPALLHWVEGPTGPKLPELLAILEHVMSAQQPVSQPDRQEPVPSKPTSEFDVPDELSSKEKQLFREALKHAFRQRPLLAAMIQDELGEDLDSITYGELNYDLAIRALIEWADSEGRLQDLFEGALEVKQRNPKLLALKKMWLR